MEGEEWINVAQDRNKLRDGVNSNHLSGSATLLGKLGKDQLLRKYSVAFSYLWV